MPDYKAMLKDAEEREAGVRKVFEQYDIDGGGTIDPAEITCVMEDLGLLKGLKTDVTTFVASAFARYDDNDDGVLSFEVHLPEHTPRAPPLPANECTSEQQKRTFTLPVSGVQEVLQRGKGRRAGSQAATSGQVGAGVDIVEPRRWHPGCASEAQGGEGAQEGGGSGEDPGGTCGMVETHLTRPPTSPAAHPRAQGCLVPPCG